MLIRPEHPAVTYLQRHKIVAKAGGHFTLMVVGESGVGKTTCEC